MLNTTVITALPELSEPILRFYSDLYGKSMDKDVSELLIEKAKINHIDDLNAVDKELCNLEIDRLDATVIASIAHSLFLYRRFLPSYCRLT